MTRLRYYMQRLKKAPTSPDQSEASSPVLKDAAKEEAPKKGRVAVDGRFFKRLWFLLKICIPRVTSPELAMVVLHTVFLILRTWLSVVVAQLDGRLVKNLVTGDGKGFIRGLGLWFGLAVPATFTNSMVRI